MNQQLSKSRLFRKTLASIMLAALVFAVISYLTTVPWLRDTVEYQEEQTGRAVLDSYYQLASNAEQDIKDWHTYSLNAHKRELQQLMMMATQALQQLDKHIQRQEYSETQARQELLQALSQLQIDGNSFDVLDAKSNQDSPLIEKIQTGESQGFHRFYQTTNGGRNQVEKLAHYRHLPEKNWTLVTSIYLDEINQEVRERRQNLIKRFREKLHATRIGKTGYLFVFDGNMKMLIHPNPNIEGENVSQHLNPMTQRSLAHELMAVAGSETDRVHYQWDRPEDPGNYVYEKISWVRYLPELDWYLASSVYLDELQATANALTQRILLIAISILLVGFIAAYWFLNRLIHPITRLAHSASQVRDGDLTVRSDIQRRDEIGFLAITFNEMVARLQDQMDHMEFRVAERTAKLAETVSDLESRNRESSVFTRMGELLLSCQTEEEVFAISVQTCQALFPEDSGRAYLADESGQLHLTDQWGEKTAVTTIQNPKSCWALRRGKTHHNLGWQSQNLCTPCHEIPDTLTICVPLLAEGTATGIIKLCCSELTPATQQAAITKREVLLATTMEHAALSVINLRLHERLHQQSIRDALTGLYNRRHLETTLTREVSRAHRHQSQLGILMLDVDHFKDFNDQFGHEAGDRVLTEVGRLLNLTLRKEDTACRYGGEEFTLVIPETNQEGLLKLAEILRQRIASQVSEVLVDLGSQPVTISIGLALYPQDGNDKESLLKAADRALYQAKEAGRNQVQLANQKTDD